MSSTQPVVTVVMLVYNRARYVRYAIESVLQQTYPHFELLVIDDASTDDSAAIIRSYKDPRIRLISNSNNLGISISRNIATQHARGRYIAVLDSDDYAYPNRLEKQVHFLDTHADHVVVGSWENWIDQDNRVIRKRKKKPIVHDDINAHLLFRSCMAHSSCMIRTGILKSHQYNPEYVVCEDYDLWARISKNYKLANIPEILISRRKHTTNISHSQTDREARLAITKSLLERLGVSFNDLDINNHILMHHYTTRGQQVPDRQYFYWAERWLNNLAITNYNKKYYKPYSFIKCIEYRWHKICRYNPFNNSYPILHYIRTPLHLNIIRYGLLTIIKQ